MKLHLLLSKFPPPAELTPGQLAQLMMTIHPALLHAPFVAWAMLSSQTESAGLGPLGSPSDTDADDTGLFGYHLSGIERIAENSARVTFKRARNANPIVLDVPAGPKDFLPLPFRRETLGLRVSARFMGLLTTMIQAHALGWDLAYIPPVLPSTASCSTSSLVRIFGALFGYEVEDVHTYKELGGRELIMHRKIEDNGATTWVPR